VEFDVEYDPGEHSPQEVDPEDSEYFPAGQDKQESELEDGA
jgi:hypothetical protein